MSYKGTTKKLFIPDFVLIQETIDKYGYNPNELEGTKSHKLLMVCTCFVCNNINDTQYAAILIRYKKNKKCTYCANKERSENNAENKSILMKEKVNNGTFIPPMLNKKHTEKSLIKMKGRNLGKSFEEIFGKDKALKIKQKLSIKQSGENNGFYGKHHTDETKENLRILKIKTTKRGKECNFYGKKYWPKRKNFVYKNIYYRSYWEIEVVKYFETNNIEWQYEPKVFKMDNRTYTPDFYLPELNKWIEVKGYFRNINKEKFSKFKELYPNINIELWDGLKLKALCILTDKLKIKK